MYVVFYGNLESGEGVSLTASDLVTLSERSDIPYSVLKREFLRKRRRYYHDKENGYVIIRSNSHYKGRARNPMGVGFSPVRYNRHR